MHCMLMSFALAVVKYMAPAFTKSIVVSVKEWLIYLQSRGFASWDARRIARSCRWLGHSIRPAAIPAVLHSCVGLRHISLDHTAHVLVLPRHHHWLFLSRGTGSQHPDVCPLAHHIRLTLHVAVRVPATDPLRCRPSSADHSPTLATSRLGLDKPLLLIPQVRPVISKPSQRRGTFREVAGEGFFYRLDALSKIQNTEGMSSKTNSPEDYSCMRCPLSILPFFVIFSATSQ